MVYLLRDTTHLESHAGHTTGHGLHDGIRQVLRQRGQHKDIHGLIDIDDALLVVDVAQRMGLQRQLCHHLLCMSAQNHQLTRGLILCVKFAAGFNEITHALILVGHALRGKQDEPFVLRQAQFATGSQLITFLIYMCVDGIGNAHDLLST